MAAIHILESLMAARKNPPLLDRFLGKIEFIPFHECWEWVAHKNKQGYGTFCLPDERNARAHRASWRLFMGVIPEGIFVCHRCDNPSCVRPEHLFLGTPRDNVLDALMKGRLRSPNRGLAGKRKENCVRGHKFTEENTFTSGGKRRCRKCIRIRDASRREIINARNREYAQKHPERI